MKEIKKQLKLERQQYHKVHLSLINCVLPQKLTPKEIEVLAEFMSLTGDIAKDRFGATARKFVKDKLGLSSAGLSGHLKHLKDKRFLLEAEEGSFSILPILFPEEEEQLYVFKLINIE